MSTPKTQFVTDDQGNRIAVVLPVTIYEQLLEAAEELEAIRAYDAAKATNDAVIPWEQALQEIERSQT